MKIWPQWAREKICRKWCPEYEKRMPSSDKPGSYLAQAFTHGFVSKVYTEEREVEGLVAAYKEARWMALWLDFFSYGSSLGVMYAVKPLDKSCIT